MFGFRNVPEVKLHEVNPESAVRSDEDVVQVPVSVQCICTMMF